MPATVDFPVPETPITTRTGSCGTEVSSVMSPILVEMAGVALIRPPNRDSAALDRAWRPALVAKLSTWLDDEGR